MSKIIFISGLLSAVLIVAEVQGKPLYLPVIKLFEYFDWEVVARPRLPSQFKYSHFTIRNAQKNISRGAPSEKLAELFKHTVYTVAPGNSHVGQKHKEHPEKIITTSESPASVLTPTSELSFEKERNIVTYNAPTATIKPTTRAPTTTIEPTTTALTTIMDTTSSEPSTTTESATAMPILHLTDEEEHTSSAIDSAVSDTTVISDREEGLASVTTHQHLITEDRRPEAPSLPVFNYEDDNGESDSYVYNDFTTPEDSHYLIRYED